MLLRRYSLVCYYGYGLCYVALYSSHATIACFKNNLVAIPDNRCFPGIEAAVHFVKRFVLPNMVESIFNFEARDYNIHCTHVRAFIIAGIQSMQRCYFRIFALSLGCIIELQLKVKILSHAVRLTDCSGRCARQCVPSLETQNIASVTAKSYCIRQGCNQVTVPNHKSISVLCFYFESRGVIFYSSPSHQAS